MLLILIGFLREINFHIDWEGGGANRTEIPDELAKNDVYWSAIISG